MTYKPTGIIHITGEPDTGKTLLALGAYHPKDTCYIFNDVKRPPVADNEFKTFIDMVTDYGDKKVLELYKSMMDRIDKLPHHDAIVWDTWARMGKSIRYYAKINPYEFREQLTFAPNGTIRNMEQWGETHFVEAGVISKLAQKCNALFLITHVKEKIIAGAKSGLNEPDCGKSFNRICNLRLWLRHNEYSGVPIALVLKRISKPYLTDDGLEVLNVLPRRIKPSQTDTSVWDAVNRYWATPMGNREPTQEEKPTPFELSILDGTLTKDQKEVWHAELKEKARQEKEELEFINNQSGNIKTRAEELSNGMPIPAIIDNIMPILLEEFGDYDEDQIKKMI